MIKLFSSNDIVLYTNPKIAIVFEMLIFMYSFTKDIIESFIKHLAMTFFEDKKRPMTNDVGNPCLSLEQTQQKGRVKPVDGIPTLPS